MLVPTVTAPITAADGSLRPAHRATQPILPRLDGRRRTQIAGGMVKCLDGKRERFFAPKVFPSRLRYSTTHLHQRIKPAAIRPWASPAVSIKPNVNEPRIVPPQHRLRQPELVQGIGR